jgi:hypothetical protein
LFIESLWRFQYTHKRRGLKDDPSLGAALYDETQGVTDLAVKLYMFAQQRAIESGKEEVTSSVIRSAASDKLRLPKPVLDALRLGDKRVLERFEDVYPVMLQTSLSPQLGDAPIANRRLSATEDKPSAAAADKCKTKVQPEDRHSKPEPPGVGAAARHNASRKKGKRQEKKAKAPGTLAGPLPQLREAMTMWPKLTVYEALKKAGHLRPVCEYLDDNRPQRDPQ